MIATETSCNRPSREKPGEMLNEGSPYPPGESGGKRYITHIDLSCWRVRTGTRASCCSSHGFPACATLYKTVTGVTARYQQVMPKKEEDTPSSGISSSVSPGFRCRRRWFSTNSLSRAYRLPYSVDRLQSARIHPTTTQRINALGSDPL